MELSEINKEKKKSIGSITSKVWQRPYASIAADITAIPIYDAVFDKDFDLATSSVGIDADKKRKSVIDNLKEKTLQKLGRGTSLARDAYVYATNEGDVPYYQVSNPMYDVRSTLKKIPLFTKEKIEQLLGASYESCKNDLMRFVDDEHKGHIDVYDAYMSSVLATGFDGNSQQWAPILSTIKTRLQENDVTVEQFVEDIMVLRIHDPESIKYTFYNEADKGDSSQNEGNTSGYRYKANGFVLNIESLRYIEYIDNTNGIPSGILALLDGRDLDTNDSTLVSLERGPSNIQLQEKDTRVSKSTDLEVYKKVLIGSGIIDQLLFVRNPFLWTEQAFQKTSDNSFYIGPRSSLLDDVNAAFMATSAIYPTTLVLLASMLFAGGHENAEELLQLYLKNERFIFRGCVFGDLVEAKNFNQDLNQESSPTFTNLLLSKKGFNDNYDDISYEDTYLKQTAPLDNGFELNNQEDLEKIYFDSVFYRSQMNSKDIGGPEGDKFAMPLDLISPSSIIPKNKASDNYFKEDVLEKKLVKSTSSSMASVFDLLKKDYTSLSDLKAVVSDNNLLLTPKGGNLVVEGNITSPTIDGIWRLLKILLEAVDDYDDGNDRDNDGNRSVNKGEQVLPFFHGLQTSSLIGLDDSTIADYTVRYEEGGVDDQNNPIQVEIKTPVPRVHKDYETGQEKYTTDASMITKNIGWKSRSGKILEYKKIVGDTVKLDKKEEMTAPAFGKRYVDILNWEPVYSPGTENDLVPKAQAFSIKKSIELVYDYRSRSFFNVGDLNKKNGYTFTRLNKNCYLNDFTKAFIANFEDSLNTAGNIDIEESGISTHASEYFEATRKDLKDQYPIGSSTEEYYSAKGKNNIFYKNASHQKQLAFRSILDDINFYKEDHIHEYNLRPMTLKHIERDLEEIRQNLRVLNQASLKYYVPKGWADKNFGEGTLAWLHRNAFEDGYARILQDPTALSVEKETYLNFAKSLAIGNIDLTDNLFGDSFDYKKDGVTYKLWIEDIDRSVIFDDGFSEIRYLRSQYDQFTIQAVADEKYRKSEFVKRGSKVAANTVEGLNEVYLAADGTWRYIHDHIRSPILKVRY